VVIPLAIGQLPGGSHANEDAVDSSHFRYAGPRARPDGRKRVDLIIGENLNMVMTYRVRTTTCICYGTFVRGMLNMGNKLLYLTMLLYF
jgi:hypothetical protein